MRIIIILLSLTSCAGLYAPSTRNAPLFRDQGEAQLSGYLSSGGIEGQVAYALTDNIAVIGSYVYGSAQRTNPDYVHKNTYAEVGLGFFDRSRSARYEVLAGYGFGEGTNLDQYYFFGLNNNVVSTGKMQKFFIQPSIGTNNRDVNLIFTPRLSYVNYYEFSTADPVATKPVAKPDEKPQFYIEPALTTKVRIKGNLHGIFQLGIALPIPGEVFYDYSPLQATIGVQIDTGGLRTRVY